MSTLFDLKADTISPTTSQNGCLEYFTRLQILHLFFNSSWGSYKNLTLGYPNQLMILV